MNAESARTIRPRLVVITDTTIAPCGLLEQRIEAIAARAKPGAILVQLRDLELPVRERLALGRRLLTILRPLGQLLAVNDRADLAVLLEADGLHLGERGLAVADARRIVGDSWISRACHAPALAGAQGADAVLLSPVLAPRKGNPALGLGGLREARATLTNGLLYALGGVDAAGAAACLECGADGVAVVGAALGDDDPLPLLQAMGILRGRAG